MRKHSFMGRVTAIGLCAMMMASSANLPAYAEENEMNFEDSVRATGYVEKDLKPADSIHQEGSPEILWGTDPLPADYITPKLPDPRSQGGYGTCWAFSSIACMEIYLMNHPEVTPNLTEEERNKIDLSELHMAYFGSFSVVDPLGGTAGDSYKYIATSPNFLAAGGSYDMAENVLSDWMGAVEEGMVPYSTAEAVLSGGLADELAYGSDVYHLQGYRRIAMKDSEDIKKAIQEYGAVGISYYDNSLYYNELTSSYYCNSKMAANHGVTLVGWDDNYSKDKFGTGMQPDSDGAWIVRNSWGSGFGNEGYFYLSYQDATIGSNGVVFIPEPADNYKYNYQYDGAVWKQYVFLPKAANMFTAAGSEGEKLEAVSFDTYSVNQDYTIQIYKNPTDSVNPETGELVATVTGVTNYEGMYTVKLDEPVYLKQGDKFVVAVSLIGRDAYREYGSIVEDKNAPDAGRVYSNSGGIGKSLAYNGWYWYDYGKKYNTNFHIKAYTNDLTVAEKVAVTGVTLSAQQVTLQKGNTTALTAQVAPENATKPGVTWTSSDTSVATVDAHGVVTAVSGGEAKITVTTVDGGYQASCDVKVEVPLQQITLNHGALSLNVGENTWMQVVYTPADTTVNKTVAWSSSNTSVATVNNTGAVEAVAPGQAVITAKVGSCTASATITVQAPPAQDTSKPDAGNNSDANSGTSTGSNSGTNSGTNTGANSGTNSGTNTGSNSDTNSGTNTGANSGTNSGTSTNTNSGTAAENNTEQGGSVPQQTGWVNTDGTWFYLNPEGEKATGWVCDGGTWYYMNGSGAMATGWVCDGGTWYYMNPSGAMATGWICDGGIWYYMNGSGAMATGWICDGGIWYYMNGSGAMATGWVNDGGTWYYMNESGAMATGWVYSGGSWYYLKSSGAMARGWLYTGGHWYYLYDSGAMAVNTRIGKYRIGANGVCK